MDGFPVLMIGPFPPPVHGQSVATDAFAALLQADGLAVERCDIGEGRVGGGTARRLSRLLTAFWRIATTKAHHVYISVNANRGIMFTALYCLVARLRRRTITLHHHAYSYIGRPSGLASFTTWAAGPDALHLANCEAMADQLRSRYSTVKHATGYGNARFVERQLRSIKRDGKSSGGVRIGHMSNLTEVKGIGRAIDLFRAARDAKLPVKLVVAGPCSDSFANKAVEAAEEEFGSDFLYLGPIYGEAKLAFFRDIDIFAFPTYYVNEAGPLVNLEAMAAGVPVISVAQCCIPSTLAGGGGIAIDRKADFVQEALAFLRQYMATPGEASAAARERFHALLVEQGLVERRVVERFSLNP